MNLKRIFRQAEQNCTFNDYIHLKKLGVDLKTIAPHKRMIGVLDIQPCKNKQFDIVEREQGIRCYITPVDSRQNHDEVLTPNWSIYDLIAWLPEYQSFYTLTGNGKLLNERAPDYADVHDVPLEVHSTILAWFKHDCRGVVILDWKDQNLWDIIPSNYQVLTDDEQTKDKLKRSLRPKYPEIMSAYG
jgi:hypothetical protein